MIPTQLSPRPAYTRASRPAAASQPLFGGTKPSPEAQAVLDEITRRAPEATGIVIEPIIADGWRSGEILKCRIGDTRYQLKYTNGHPDHLAKAGIPYEFSVTVKKDGGKKQRYDVDCEIFTACHALEKQSSRVHATKLLNYWDKHLPEATGWAHHQSLYQHSSNESEGRSVSAQINNHKLILSHTHNYRLQQDTYQIQIRGKNWEKDRNDEITREEFEARFNRFMALAAPGLGANPGVPANLEAATLLKSLPEKLLNHEAKFLFYDDLDIREGKRQTSHFSMPLGDGLEVRMQLEKNTPANGTPSAKIILSKVSPSNTAEQLFYQTHDASQPELIAAIDLAHQVVASQQQESKLSGQRQKAQAAFDSAKTELDKAAQAHEAMLEIQRGLLVQAKAMSIPPTGN